MTHLRARIPICVFLLTIMSMTAAAQLLPGFYVAGKPKMSAIDKAFKQAQTQNKILMVEFGADWCADCVVLDRTLNEGATKNYFQQHFVIASVDVGQFDRNIDVMKSLGVKTGAIPTAVFFNPDGSRIGATNRNELEPARKYGSKQILGFLKEIAERKQITSPARFD